MKTQDVRSMTMTEIENACRDAVLRVKNHVAANDLMVGTYQVTYRKNNQLHNVSFSAKTWGEALEIKNAMGNKFGFQCATLVLVEKRLA